MRSVLRLRHTVPLLVVAMFAGCGVASDTEGTASEEAPEASQPAEPAPLDVESVSARLEAGEDITLLDVRTTEELERDGAIEGYLHIPIDELEGRLAEVPREKPIVAY